MDDSMDNNMDEEPAIDTARSRLPSIDQLLQVTPVSPAIGANTPPFGFDPLLYDIEPHVWTTDLDRILVLCVKLDGTVTIWFRLIGPRQTLNLKLNAIVSGSPVATLEVTTGSVPKTHQNLTDYNVVTRGCFFADPYAFIYQHSLDKWTFSGHTTQERCIEVSLWAFVVSSRSLGTYSDSFQVLHLRMPGPSRCLRVDRVFHWRSPSILLQHKPVDGTSPFRK